MQDLILEENAQAIQEDSGSEFILDDGIKHFAHNELNDLVCDLGLSKDGAEFFGFLIKEENLLAFGVTYSWYIHRERDLTVFYSAEAKIVFCNDIHNLIAQLSLRYKSP